MSLSFGLSSNDACRTQSDQSSSGLFFLLLTVTLGTPGLRSTSDYRVPIYTLILPPELVLSSLPITSHLLQFLVQTHSRFWIFDTIILSLEEWFDQSGKVWVFFR